MTYKLDEIAYRGEFWFLKNKRTGMLIKQCRVAPFIFFFQPLDQNQCTGKSPNGRIEYPVPSLPYFPMQPPLMILV